MTTFPWRWLIRGPWWRGKNMTRPSLQIMIDDMWAASSNEALRIWTPNSRSSNLRLNSCRAQRKKIIVTTTCWMWVRTQCSGQPRKTRCWHLYRASLQPVRPEDTSFRRSRKRRVPRQRILFLMNFSTSKTWSRLRSHRETRPSRSRGMVTTTTRARICLTWWVRRSRRTRRFWNR